MQGQSPSDVIKPEVRRLSAYTLKHVKADVKLDQNENPYELPQDLKEEVLAVCSHGRGDATRNSFRIQ
jgi:histidinol-phosphate/aromatic aminotransferase/cobyric acid decarboxylase-like protein